MPVLSCLPTAVYFLISAGSVSCPTVTLLACCLNAVIGRCLVLTAIQIKTNTGASDLIAF